MSKKKTFAVVEHHDWITQIRIEQDRVVETRDLVELKEYLQQAADENSGEALLVDCSQVQMVSTGALAILLKHQRQLFEGGRRLKLYGLGDKKITAAANDSYCHEIFKVFGLDRFFDICRQTELSLEECLAGMIRPGATESAARSSKQETISC